MSDADFRTVQSIGMLPVTQRTPAIVNGLLSKTFVETHPTLVRMLSSPDMDTSILALIIERIRLVQKGNEGVHEASVDVGGALARTYFPKK